VREYLLVLLVAASVTYLLTVVAREIAIRSGAVDIPLAGSETDYAMIAREGCSKSSNSVLVSWRGILIACIYRWVLQQPIQVCCA